MHGAVVGEALRELVPLAAAAHPEEDSIENGLARQRDEVTAFYSATKDWEADHEEVDALPATDAQVRQAGGVGAMPLVVLTAGTEGLSPAAEQAWQELQSELAALSTNSLHRTIVGSNHLSLVFNQHDAQATIMAIEQVVAAARTHQVLTPEEGVLEKH